VVFINHFYVSSPRLSIAGTGLLPCFTVSLLAAGRLLLSKGQGASPTSASSAKRPVIIIRTAITLSKIP
jgi:hypothetical protein